MSSAVLPEFMHQGAAASRYWGRLFTDFAGFQVAVRDDDDHVVGAGNSVPFAWDGRPVWMDLELDLGTYEDTNVWMRHPIEAEK